MEIPIYCNEDIIVDQLPPEVKYSTYPGLRFRIIGYVCTDGQLEKHYAGGWGAQHNHPNKEYCDFFSTRSLLIYAMANRSGLSWKPEGKK